MSQDSLPPDRTTEAKPPAEAGGEPDTYVHESAGIRERSGYIPTWLSLVAVGLIVWGIYYMIRFWSSV
jgi:cbb3-type cytochrome oxidase subunit FixP-like protein